MLPSFEAILSGEHHIQKERVAFTVLMPSKLADTGGNRIMLQKKVINFTSHRRLIPLPRLRERGGNTDDGNWPSSRGKETSSMDMLHRKRAIVVNIQNQRGSRPIGYKVHVCYC